MSKSDFRDNITDKVLEKIMGEFTINSILDKKITDLTEIEAKFFTQKNIGIITNRKYPKDFNWIKVKQLVSFIENWMKNIESKKKK